MKKTFAVVMMICMLVLTVSTSFAGLTSVWAYDNDSSGSKTDQVTLSGEDADCYVLVGIYSGSGWGTADLSGAVSFSASQNGVGTDSDGALVENVSGTIYLEYELNLYGGSGEAIAEVLWY